MKMRKTVSVDACRPGMMVASDVINGYGVIIISENMTLSTQILQKLRLNRIKDIQVYEEVSSGSNTGKEIEFKDFYYKATDDIKLILNSIGKGEKLELVCVKDIVRSLLVQDSKNISIFPLLNKIKSYDFYTYEHLLNVALLAVNIGKWLKYSPKQLEQLAYAGVLHDIGKMKVSQSILNKPASLEPEEYEQMKQHAILGYHELINIEGIDKDVCIGVVMHHEREDGSGYPQGLKGEDIHPYGKILAIADVYDAMTSNRVYHRKENPFQVLGYMAKNSFGHLDTKVLMSFFENIVQYYIGEQVLLNNGVKGVVIFINPNNIDRPLLRGENGIIDLVKERELQIVKFI